MNRYKGDKKLRLLTGTLRNDLTNKQFCRLYAYKAVGVVGNTHTYYLCSCSCGNIVIVRGDSLVNGRVVSCGCYQRERVTKHGGYYTEEYGVWNGIKNRCNNKNDKSYQRYGGRGISVSSSWEASFNAFIEDMGKRPSNKYSIERLDNDGDYCKENCEWRTVTEQNRNKRNNRYITYKNETHCLSEWAEIKGINYSTLKSRLNIGHWDFGRAIGDVYE